MTRIESSLPGLTGPERQYTGVATPLFFAFAAVAAFLLLALSDGLTFFLDEWEVIQRPDWSLDSLLSPHNEHPYLGPVVVYRLLLEVFGLGSTLPFQIVNVALVVLVAWLVLVLVRRRLGAWAGLIAATLLLFMGAAWEDLLWPAGISFMGSTAAGLGAFVLLDRERRPSDGAVCALLVLSLCFSTLGLVFTVGVAADVILRDRARPLRERLARAWVPAVPVALYGIWFLAYGHEAEGNTSLDNLLGIPLYLWNAASAVFASLLDLVEVDPENGALNSAGWGKPILIAGLVGAAILISRSPRIASTMLWSLATTAVVFWASAGLNASAGRDPGASRYQLVGGALVLLIAAELARGRRLPRPWLVVGGALAALAVVSGIGQLRDGERFRRAQSDLDRAQLSVLEIARDEVDPAFPMTEETIDTPYLITVHPGEYLDAVDRWGSPVDPSADLIGASEQNRARADFLLASILGVELEPAPSSPGGGCRELSPNAVTELPPDGLTISGEGAVEVRVRRFAATTFATVGSTTEGSLLQIPPDESEVPWTVQVGGAPARVCPGPAS